MINEVFYGLQGEGKTQGQFRQFIRFNGCPLSCKFCDTAYTWGKGDKKVKLPKQLHNHLVLSGGEPTLPGTWEFICQEILSDYSVDWIEIETNGTQDLTLNEEFRHYIQNVDLWNISPKRLKDQKKHCNVTPILLKHKDWLNDYIVKFVVDYNNFSSDLKFIRSVQRKYSIPNEKIWVMPLTTKDATHNEINTEFTYDFAFKHKFNFTPRLHVVYKGNKRGV